MSLLSPLPLPTFPQPQSRKRRALDSPARPDVPRTLTQKRARPHSTPERPAWVLDHTNSLHVSTRLSGVSAVEIYPSASGTPATEISLFTELFNGAGGFTVLCFLGFGGEETLRAVGGVSTLLAALGARCYGVSLVPPNAECGLPILHDRHRSLTTRLGLLHPLGGGRTALDAVVVLDSESRARMVLPIGWGARPTQGGCVDEPGNRWENVVARLVRGVEWLRDEAEDEVEMVM